MTIENNHPETSASLPGFGENMVGIMRRVDVLSFRSKPDLLQRHKTCTNIYPFIEKERRKGLREGSRKKRENYSQSKFLFQKQCGINANTSTDYNPN